MARSKSQSLSQQPEPCVYSLQDAAAIAAAERDMTESAAAIGAMQLGEDVKRRALELLFAQHAKFLQTLGRRALS